MLYRAVLNMDVAHIPASASRHLLKYQVILKHYHYSYGIDCFVAVIYFIAVFCHAISLLLVNIIISNRVNRQFGYFIEDIN